MKLQVDVCFQTEDLLDRSLDGTAVVALDILRATSSIVTAMAAGAEAVYPVASVEAAMERAERLRQEGLDVLLCGERGGLPPEGFDLGNSPAEYTETVVKGKHLVLTTTNGTRLLESCSGANGPNCPSQVIIGALLNRNAVANALLDQSGGILLACAGTEGHFSLDDFYGAGAIVKCLVTQTDLEMSDAAAAAMKIYLLHQSDMTASLRRTNHGQRLVHTGLESDLSLCAQIDTFRVVPEYKDGVITCEEVVSTS